MMLMQTSRPEYKHLSESGQPSLEDSGESMRRCLRTVDSVLNTAIVTNAHS